MIIDKDISPLLVTEHEPLRHALDKMSKNKKGMVICTDDSGLLIGILTDGDFRRWVISAPEVNMDIPVSHVINRSIESGRVTDSVERMQSVFDDRIQFLPLLDHEGRIEAIAYKRTGKFTIADKGIGEGNPCYIIAEIGNNHNGDVALAYKLIDKAVEAGADCAKFQLRDLSTLYLNKGNASDASEDLGSQYTLDLLSRFQLEWDDMRKVFDYCHSRDITPLCTPWDNSSVEKLLEYGIAAFKSASADFTNHDFLSKLASTGLPLICSTGMSTESEIRESTAILSNSGARFALLHCNSTYPAPFKDINLQYMQVLRQIGNCPVGYSSHDRGENIAVAAVTLGANIIEKHFTLDRDMEGNDHRVSLLPAEFTSMVRGIRQVEQALGGTSPRIISQGELMNREALGKSLVINVILEKGQVIESHMLEARSPGKGLQPNRKHELVGRLAKRDLDVGDMLYPSDLDDNVALPRDYSFKRHFGIPIRYHDLDHLAVLSNFDFLEFHLSYMDMQLDESKYFNSVYDMDLIVHAPELFENDHVLDLCSLDPEYRKLSIKNLERVVEVTRRLKMYFSKAECPRIVVNVGGFTQDKPLEKREREVRYEMVADAFKQIDLSDVEIIPQTMPPFPWHFGGQRYQNLFMDPWEIRDYCMKHNIRVCLDTSHSKLACNHHHWSFSDFMQLVGPHTAHLHIADASGVDGEGLQINEGDIDFPALGRDLGETAPSASFLPEIWQGHKDGGTGFWLAFEKLERYL
jgi:sialic acid synthase SpsE/sugar phosphate isomerase/epimerase